MKFSKTQKRFLGLRLQGNSCVEINGLREYLEAEKLVTAGFASRLENLSSWGSRFADRLEKRRKFMVSGRLYWDEPNA